MKYGGDLGTGEPEPWKVASYEVFFRDPREVLRQQLGNPDFAEEMDFAPKRIFDVRNDGDPKRRYQDFMSGNWAWRQAVSLSSLPHKHRSYLVQDAISINPGTHGAVFCPVILGSDKTTVSVAT
jgi:hypothetical protein